jgi:hypothetical protein
LLCSTIEDLSAAPKSGTAKAANLKIRDIGIVNDADLERLTVKELRELMARIETAIRAGIRAKMTAKTQTQTQPTLATEKAAPSAIIDLERERDMWLMSRRA